MKYIVEVRNGNPRILMRNNAGEYECIGFSAGEDNLKHIKDLVSHANSDLARPMSG